MSDQQPENKTHGFAGSNPSMQKVNSTPEPEGTQVKSSRRQALKRFASYTAPAMIALITANEASATA